MAVLSEDEQIVRMFIEHDESAITATQQKYGRLLTRIASNVLNSPEDVEECVNDTLYAAWRAIPKAQPRNLMGYLCQIVRYQALKRYEYEHAGKRSPQAVISLSELSADLPDDRFSLDMDGPVLGEYINDFLKELPETSRDIFIQRYYFFDSIETISGKYSFTESKVKSILFRARNKLMTWLTKKGVYL